eukprot:6211982-Pleurochrysis_carterae.AAC.1
MSVVCGEGILLVTTRPATPQAHSHTVRTEAENPLDHGAAMRYESTQQNPRRKRATGLSQRNRS